jgi:pyruvate,orthophosphate dikinase
MYADVVHGASTTAEFEDIARESHKEDRNGFSLDTEMSKRTTGGRWSPSIKADRSKRENGAPFPQEHGRADLGRRNVRFWVKLAERDRAITYRRLHRHSRCEWGTAVNDPGHGVRQYGRRRRQPASPSRAIPATGAKRAWYGEFLVNAQGEDVVAGIRTPQYLTEIAASGKGGRQRHLSLESLDADGPSASCVPNLRHP